MEVSSNLATLAAARCCQGCQIGREIASNLAILPAVISRPAEMVFRSLLSALIKRSDAVEKLAESRPVRRAAQLTAAAAAAVLRSDTARLGGAAAAAVLRSNTARLLRRERLELPRSLGDLSGKAGRLKDSLARDVKDGVDGAARQIKRKGR